MIYALFLWLWNLCFWSTVLAMTFVLGNVAHVKGSIDVCHMWQVQVWPLLKSRMTVGSAER